MLRDEAMIVRLAISQWTARRFDKRVTEQVAHDYDVNPDVGRYRKILVAEGAVKEVTKTAGAARTFHYENTLPWDDNGGRILPAANFLAYSKEMRGLKADFEKAVAEFVSGYEAYVEEARRRLKAMFKTDDYPSPGRIVRRYGFTFDIEPVPNFEDFRVNIQNGDAKRIKREMEKMVADREAKAMADLYVRLSDVISHFAEKLSNSKAIFRDSLVENVVELVNLLPKLNVANDPKLEKLGKEAQKKLCAYEPEQLRKDETAREAAADDAKAILKKMEAYVGAKA